MAKSIAVAILNRGLARKYNEDNLYLIDSIAPPSRLDDFERLAKSDDTLQIYAVTDGMGGHTFGDTAARAVLEAIDQQRRRLRPGARLDFSTFAKEVADRANRLVRGQLAAYEGLPVGATLTLLAIDRDTAYTLNLGNSRAYLYRDNTLTQLTQDHVQQTPDRRRLTRYLGFLPDWGRPEADSLTATRILAGDIFLLTTDGLTDALSNETIAGVLSEQTAFALQIRRLKSLALEQGGLDNLAIVGIRIQDPAHLEQKTGRRPKTPASGHSSLLETILKAIIVFLLFVLLGMLAGKLLFSMPAWLKVLFGI